MDIKSLVKKITHKNVIDALFVAAVIFMGVFFHWKITEIAVFSLFIWIILNPISSRYLALMVIFLLILTPFFLIFKKQLIADQLAIYAYYFLIMTVIMTLYELRKDNQSGDEI